MTRRRFRLSLTFAALLAVGCDLNPQPLPPGDQGASGDQSDAGSPAGLTGTGASDASTSAPTPDGGGGLIGAVDGQAPPVDHSDAATNEGGAADAETDGGEADGGAVDAALDASGSD